MNHRLLSNKPQTAYFKRVISLSFIIPNLTNSCSLVTIRVFEGFKPQNEANYDRVVKPHTHVYTTTLCVYV